jgi:CO/xanthine dehydrogenase FAD-binding subunit
MSLEIVKAKSVGDAAKALADDPAARFLAGGTLLMRQHNSGDVLIRRLILADGLGLDRIRLGDGRAELGALVTMAKVAAHPGLAFLSPVAREIGGPAVRAMATVGGNLFAPSPYGDLAVALLALDAKVTIEGPRGDATLALEEFLAERATHAGAVLRGVGFDLPAAGAFRFAKVARRHPHGASVLSVAVHLPLADGRVKGARVAYGAMAPSAIRARAVESELEGKALDEASMAGAVAVASEGTSPASDPFASAWYRRRVLPIHLARLLKR